MFSLQNFKSKLGFINWDVINKVSSEGCAILILEGENREESYTSAW